MRRIDHLGRFLPTHGMHKTSTYRSWISMRSRCRSENHHRYSDYGAKGVEVCDRWLNSFDSFLADMGERPKGTTLDRWPDPNGNYEPDNCRWATSGEQARNRKSTKLITYKGRTQCVRDWEVELGFKKNLLSSRVQRGLTGDDLFKPPRKKRPNRKLTRADISDEASPL